MIALPVVTKLRGCLSAVWLTAHYAIIHGMLRVRFGELSMVQVHLAWDCLILCTAPVAAVQMLCEQRWRQRRLAAVAMQKCCAVTDCIDRCAGAKLVVMERQSGAVYCMSLCLNGTAGAH
jgi:hypothetical protein